MKYRDLNLIPWDEETYLVISCDSAGGIGDKIDDIVKTEPRILGFHTAQVVLMEMLSIGVYPFFLSNTVSVEMNPTGLQIIEGIKDALRILDLEEVVEITGSSEENMKVKSSGIGLTLLGRVRRQDFRFPQTNENDLAVVIGTSACGQDVLDGDERERFSLSAMKKIMGKEYIHEMIPGGSGGIFHEITQLESRSELVFRRMNAGRLNIHASSGPATSALVTLSRKDLDQFRKDIGIPVEIIGEFIKGEENENLWGESL